MLTNFFVYIFGSVTVCVGETFLFDPFRVVLLCYNLPRIAYGATKVWLLRSLRTAKLFNINNHVWNAWLLIIISVTTATQLNLKYFGSSTQTVTDPFLLIFCLVFTFSNFLKFVETGIFGLIIKRWFWSTYRWCWNYLYNWIFAPWAFCQSWCRQVLQLFKWIFAIVTAIVSIFSFIFVDWHCFFLIWFCEIVYSL